MSLEDFKIVSELEGGLTSQIYKAVYNNEQYIIKKISTSLQIINVINEIQILNILDHDNISKLEYYFNDTSHHYLIFKNYGVDLIDYVKTPITESKVIKYFKQLVSALLHLAEHNIIHYDIKPENIIYDEKEDKMILIDFGLSVLGSKCTIKAGTENWMAPELKIKHIKIQYTNKIDVFSLAKVMYALIIGGVPIFRNNKVIIFNKYPISEQFKDILFKCLEHNPDTRIDIHQLNVLLEKI